MPRELKKKIMSQFTYVDFIMRKNEGILLKHQLTSTYYFGCISFCFQNSVLKYTIIPRQGPSSEKYQIRPFVGPKVGYPNTVQMSMVSENLFI